MKVHSILRIHLFLILCIYFLPLTSSVAEIDPWSIDPWSDSLSYGNLVDDDKDDEDKSAAQLIEEGRYLAMDQRHLDARSKWLRALKKEPSNYMIHLLLSGYYLETVNHYRLAMRYLKQAMNLFEEQRGQPPYSSPMDQELHSSMLILLSSTRLNLDDYKGALEALDKYSRHGYMATWYPSSRAWVLMKLGRIKDAIDVARTGYLLIPDSRARGSILNMLGILLSIDGRREDALKILEDAIRHEYSLGNSGQPGTPLNNQGEVYHELFKEDFAERNFLKATRDRDGCDHVLPSWWLTVLYIEQLNLNEATQALDRFQACIAQFPLKNTEEYKAIVHLARGRIDLHQGKIDSALSHFDAALSRQQWFGKIGTSATDMQAASLTSYAQALNAKAKKEAFRIKSGISDRLQSALYIRSLKFRSYWTRRRALKVLISQLNDFEDLAIHNTDSFLEYPTLGWHLAPVGSWRIQKKVESSFADDSRAQAHLYYQSYIAEALAYEGKKTQALEIVENSLAKTRNKFDNLLRAQLLSLKLRLLNKSSADYITTSHQLFELHPTMLVTHGLTMPVGLNSARKSLSRLIRKSAFSLDNSSSLVYSISAEYPEDVGVRLKLLKHSITLTVAEGATETEALNNLVDKIFYNSNGK